jgi:hypothetical protein
MVRAFSGDHTRSIFGTVRTVCRCGTGQRTVSLSQSEQATARFVWQEVPKYRPLQK